MFSVGVWAACAVVERGDDSSFLGTLCELLEYNEIMDILQIPMEVYSMYSYNQNSESQWNGNSGCGCGQDFRQNDTTLMRGFDGPYGRGCIQPFEPECGAAQRIPVVEWPEGRGCASPCNGFDAGQANTWPCGCRCRRDRDCGCGCNRGCGCGCDRGPGCCGW